MITIKKLLPMLLCASVAVMLWLTSSYFSSAHHARERALQEHERVHVGAAQHAAHVSENLWHRAANARTLEEWDTLLHADVAAMAEDDRKQFRTLIQGKRLEALFWQAEILLAHARGLLEQDQNSPIAGQYLDQARQIYEQIEELMPELGEIADNDIWNANVYYLKGVYYFRLLIFIKNMQKEQSRVKDALAQSVASLSTALRYAPKNRDIEVAIEVLQKQGKRTLSSADANKDKMTLQLLPAKDKEVGPFQTGPREEGKH